ncbi:MAG: hypothetical protein HY544_01485 [Candidatus Diapherotrites archaeon]|uniref:Uncharacterized protein n=1 Tax=Candidatus Iainarchaeum sp. TaxID=3101447 RepID=A0A8T3YI01_9ARCH|nr:hypothetical protein [Candidatus Diapherotrites archaeon]
MSKDNNAIWFLIGANYWKPIMILVLAAIALFAIFGTIVFIWTSLPK